MTWYFYMKYKIANEITVRSLRILQHDLPMPSLHNPLLSFSRPLAGDPYPRQLEQEGDTKPSHLIPNKVSVPRIILGALGFACFPL